MNWCLPRQLEINKWMQTPLRDETTIHASVSSDEIQYRRQRAAKVCPPCTWSSRWSPKFAACLKNKREFSCMAVCKVTCASDPADRPLCITASYKSLLGCIHGQWFHLGIRVTYSLRDLHRKELKSPKLNVL